MGDQAGLAVYTGVGGRMSVVARIHYQQVVVLIGKDRLYGTRTEGVHPLALVGQLAADGRVLVAPAREDPLWVPELARRFRREDRGRKDVSGGNDGCDAGVLELADQC